MEATGEDARAALEAERRAIDDVDREIVRLLASRLRRAAEIGRLKSASGNGLVDGTREDEVATRWRSLAAAEALPQALADAVLREVVDHARRRQEPALGATERATVRVAFQGVRGAYSELAARKLFDGRGDARLESLGFPTFAAAADAVERGDVDYALLPIENSITGAIGEVDELLAERTLHVVDEEVWSVEHCLVGVPGASAEGVRRVRSHPVALAQCARTLQAMPGVSVEPFFDTAGAAASVRELGDASVAALCDEGVARRLGLEVLRRRMADHAENRTRSVLLGRAQRTLPAGIAAKTSLVLRLDHRRGALARVLDALAAHDVNLTRIESRPLPEEPWQYRFFVDLEGRPDEPPAEAALADVRRNANHVRVLGVYPDRTRTREVRAPAVVPASGAESATAPAAPKKRASGPPLARLPEDGRRTIVRVGDVEIGGDRFVLILGPCAVESREQIDAAAAMVAARGASLLRGGAFKPRSSPYAFQGLGLEGLELLADAGEACGLPVVTEVLRPEDVEAVARRADVLQIGARNMQNFALLERVGATDRPVLLKRGMSATIEELLHAAEYVLAKGNPRVILCERGIRTFETATRNTLDVSAIPVLKERTHLPVIVDPSHAAGRRALVVPLALAAAAAGADGLIVEAHPDPDGALCDKEQALAAADLDALRAGLEPIVAARGIRL